MAAQMERVSIEQSPYIDSICQAKQELKVCGLGSTWNTFFSTNLVTIKRWYGILAEM